MIKVGLTGNIGSGKSTIAKIFKTLEAPVFNADIEAKKLYLEPHVLEKVEAIAGSQVLDDQGNLNRQALAGVIFNDQEKLNAINNLIHPLVRKRYYEWLENNIQSPYTVMEAAIMIEGGLYRQMDRLVIVSASEQVRLERVARRDGLEKKEISQRMQHQLKEEVLLQYADNIIDNNGEKLVIPQVLAIHKALTKA